eukprot:1160633-Pelagomonas_calceolata.AAC.7
MLGHAGHLMVEQGKAGSHTRFHRASSGWGRAEQGRAGQGHTHGYTGHLVAGQSRAGQSRAGSHMVTPDI